MKWASYVLGGEARTGVLFGHELFAVEDGRTIIDLLRSGPQEMARTAETARRTSRTVADVSSVRLLPVVPRPGAVRDGLCFLDHLRGCLRALGLPGDLPPVWQQIPAFYFTNPSSLIGAHDDVEVFPGSSKFDFEAEIGAVIGRGGRDLPPSRALDAIAGFTIFCDWSARDLQLHERPLGIGQAKGKDGATTLGPFLVTTDELGPSDIELRASVNGRVIAAGSTSTMDWSFAELVSYASRGTELRPGDVIGSGTIPGGCLLEHAPPEGDARWLEPGDVVEIHSPQLGSLRNTVVPGAPVHRLRSGF